MSHRNPFCGIAAANTVAQLDALVKNAKIQEALQTRTAARILGVPPGDIESDDMLAGGDITINRGSAAPWLACAIVLAVAIVAATALIVWRWDVAPVKSNPPPPPPPSKSSDYIEFYKP